jgi:hypothetical protein
MKKLKNARRINPSCHISIRMRSDYRLISPAEIDRINWLNAADAIMMEIREPEVSGKDMDLMLLVCS